MKFKRCMRLVIQIWSVRPEMRHGGTQVLLHHRVMTQKELMEAAKKRVEEALKRWKPKGKPNLR